MDFSCYITRDRQPVLVLKAALLDEPMTKEEEMEEEDFPLSERICADTAVIVLVPDTVDRDELDRWPLSKFRSYAAIESGYDGTDFEAVEGYSKYREDCDYEGSYIWRSAQYPGYWLVNFESTAYELLVKGSVDALRIPYEWYDDVLESRGLIDYCYTDKSTVYDMILENRFLIEEECERQ
jgi:hypothetical protein